MGLKQSLQNDPVRDLTLRKLITASEDCTIRAAVEKMREGGIGCVVVIDDDGKPLGTMTEGIVRNLLLEDTVSLDEPIAAYCARPATWVYESDPVSTVLDAMQSHNIRFVVVVDQEGRAQALTGQKGMMEYIANHFSEQVMVQRIGSHPYPSSREGA